MAAQWKKKPKLKKNILVLYFNLLWLLFVVHHKPDVIVAGGGKFLLR